MSNLHIATSPLTGTIFAGTTVKNGSRWGKNKTDVTEEALFAVIEHILLFNERHNKDVIIYKEDGTPEFKVTVERIK